MKLTAYLQKGHHIDIRTAPVGRAWMEATNQRFAYRCLPLNIANSMGWELLCPAGFVSEWDGGQGLEAIQVRPDPGTVAPALSHFGHGILTFHVPCLFRTEPGYDLVAQGPVNSPKDSVAPLAGVIETDWAPYSFTMNWKFTRPGAAVRFERGEPFCHIFPFLRGALEAIEPEVRQLDEDPELARQHQQWAATRLRFNKELAEPGSQAQAQKWEKQYYRGITPDGTAASEHDHRTRLRLKDFVGLEPQHPAETEASRRNPQDHADAPIAAERPSGSALSFASNPETVKTFWHGELNAYQLLCLRSFADRGHHVVLFSYDPSLALPAWIERRDAAEILSPERVLSRSVNGSEASLAHVNLFRYALLQRDGGWWFDADTVLLKADLPQDQMFFAASGERDFVSPGLVKFPRGHPLLAAAVEQSNGSEVGLWAHSGAALFTQLLNRHGLMQYCRPREEISPIPWFELEALFDPKRVEEVRSRCAASCALDLHHEFWRGAGIPHRLAAPEGSFLDLLIRQQSGDLKFAPRMDYADVASWIKHLRDNIALDTRLRLAEASHREYEARCAALQRELTALRTAPGGRA
jgi:Family of unknown function (DUF6065)